MQLKLNQQTKIIEKLNKRQRKTLLQGFKANEMK